MVLLYKSYALLAGVVIRHIKFVYGDTSVVSEFLRCIGVASVYRSDFVALSF